MNAPPSSLTPDPEASDKSRQRPLDFRIIWRLFGYTSPYRTIRTWSLIMVGIRAFQMPILAWMIGRVINGPITHHDMAGTVHGAIVFLALAAVMQICFHFRIRLVAELGEAVIRDLRRDIFAHLLKMPMGHFNQTGIGRIISRFTSDADVVRKGVQEVFFITVAKGGQMVVTAALMIWCDPVLFLLVLAMAPGLALLNHHFRRSLSRATRALQESWSNVTMTLAESVMGIRTIQGYRRQALNTERFADLIADHARYNLDVARSAGIFMPLLTLNGQIFAALLLIIGGYRVLTPEIRMDYGNLIQFFLLANVFFRAIRPIGQMYFHSQKAMAGAERIFQLLDTPPDWPEPPEPHPSQRMAGRVEFRRVTFHYAAHRSALNDVSFVAAPGQAIALVGPTGSGKSSIVNLVAKFFLPDSGAVLIDGQNIRDINGTWLHRHIGLVVQPNYLFSGTVMENIRIGRPTASDAAVIEAVSKLDLLDVIETLPQGFATQVGERGQGLSQGQSQLICFARAMLVEPRILILDEATSAVDTITEARLQHAFIRLVRGRTSFIVAHRLSTIREADLVLVLDQNRIVERGTHTFLLEQGGAYAQLYRQFVKL